MCCITHTSAGIHIKWVLGGASIAIQIINGELAVGSLVFYKKYITDEIMPHEVAPEGEAMIYLDSKSLHDYSYIIIYTSQSDILNVTYSKPFNIKSIYSYIWQLILIVCISPLLIYILKIVIITYIIQICLSWFEAWYLYYSSKHSKKNIDERLLESDWGLLTVLMQYPIIKAHNNVRAIVYHFYNKTKIFNKKNIPILMLQMFIYLASGIGRCGWDIIESLVRSWGIQYQFLYSRFANEIRSRSNSQINKKIYFYKYKGYINPEWLKKLLAQYGAENIKKIHKNIDDIYIKYSREVIRGLTNRGLSRDHMSYINEHSEGITFTHDQSEGFRETSKEGIWSSYIKINNPAIQNVTVLRTDLLENYSYEFVRSELFQLHIGSIQDNNNPFIQSFHNKNNIILLVKKKHLLGIGTNNSINQVNKLLHNKQIQIENYIKISALSKNSLNNYITEFYLK